MARKKFITHTEATTSIDILGNAGTATKLKNYVQINGLSFNGSVGLIADPLIEQDLSTNATRYLSFVDSTTATYQRLNVDDTLNYNPSTGALSATIFRGTLDGTAILASKLSSPRTISLSGDVTGSVNFDGSSNVNITATVADYSHNHIISNVDGLQAALDSKLDSNSNLLVNPNTTASNPDTLNMTGIDYCNSISLFGQTDGALYTNSHSSSWQHQIYGDYRTGKIAARGKNNGTWQAWKEVAYTDSNITGTAAGINGDNYRTLDFGHQANTLLSGGGTISVDASGYVKWTKRFIVIASGRHPDYSAELGHFDITVPTSGTITGVGGATNKTATAAGIPLASWETLYYILPVGATNGSVASNFRVASYTSNVDIPSTWLKICKRHDDSPTYVEFSNGVSLKLGESLDTDAYDVKNAEVAKDVVGGAATITGIKGTTQTIANNYGNYQHIGGWGVARTATSAVLVNTAYMADILSTARTINGVSFNGSANITVADSTKLPTTGGTLSGNVLVNNYGIGLVGLYSATRYQNVFSMGDAYKLAADGTGVGTMYGIAWTHSNIGGQSKAGLSHQALFMTNGVTQTAIGTGIWTLGGLTVGGTVSFGTGNTRGLLGAQAQSYSTGQQFIMMTMKARTTSTTAVRATSDGGGATATNQYTIPANYSGAFTGQIIAKREGNLAGIADVKGFEIKGIVTRGSTTASTVVSGTVTALGSGTLGANVVLALDTVNGGLAINCNSTSAININFSIVLYASEITLTGTY